MDRRTFIVIVGSAAALAVAPAAEAQPGGKTHRAAFLLFAPRERAQHLVAAFEGGSQDLGYTPGRNISIDYRFADGKPERFPGIVAEVVRLNVDVIVTGSNANLEVVRSRTTTIPVVFTNAADPVAAGFVTSLARPGGNMTGITADASPGIWGEYFEFLRDRFRAVASRDLQHDMDRPVDGPVLGVGPRGGRATRPGAAIRRRSGAG